MNLFKDWLLLKPLWKFLLGYERLVVGVSRLGEKRVRRVAVYLKRGAPGDDELLRVLDKVSVK